MDGLDPLLSESNWQREELGLRNHGLLHEGALDHTLLARQPSHDPVGKVGPGVGHREGGGAAACLGLHDLVAAEHDPVRQRVALRVGEGARRLRLRQQGHDGGAGVAADHGHLGGDGVAALGVGDEGPGAAHVQGGDAKELPGVVDALLLQHLRGDGDSGVHRVRDDQDARLGACLRDPRHQVLDDAGVDVEEIVARHAWFARDARGDHDDVAAVQGGLQLVASVAGALRVRADMRQVGGDAWRDRGHVEAG
mmetsp:Transcript_80394/g.209705  ORF Transcript_80394/g.209705 Transcript_80394/m.209705 type:complete len:252 (+) Transcript_80394:348-1103(+)